MVLLRGISTFQVLFMGLVAAVLYVAGCLLYLLLLHPMAKYPGPLLAKLTNLYAAYHAWKGDIHLDIALCHKRYGKFVRYGPNRIVVNSATGIKDIYGKGKDLRKSRGYKALVHRVPNTFTLIDKKEHSWKRRILTQGFSDAAMRRFEPDILGYIRKLCQIMIEEDLLGQQKTWTSPKNMSNWSSYFSFDIMSKVIFGQSYNLIGDPEHRAFVKDIERNNVRISVLYNDLNVQSWRIENWLFPDAMKGRKAFLKYIGQFLHGAQQGKVDNERDLFFLLQNAEDPETGKRLSATELRAEAATLIAAGMDTTSTAIASVFFYLTHYPRVRDDLTKEIRETFTSASEICLGSQLSGCKYLQSCIDESMRMSPPAGGPLWREVEPSGTLIDGHFFPGGCDVGAGIYAVHHNDANFQDASSFHPERWLSPIEISRSAFVPFSVGPRGCMGKPLSMAELRLGIAYIVWHYDMRLADGPLGCVGAGSESLGQGREDPHEYQLYDHINARKDGPYVVFKKANAG